MKRAHAELLAKVMLAYTEGKAIERYHNGKWYEDSDPDFDCRIQWRVKPEPTVLWIHKSMIGSGSLIVTENPNPNLTGFIKFQEVIE